MTTRNTNRRPEPSRSQSFFEPLEDRRLMSAGALDTSFAGTGKTTLNFGSGVSVTALDVALQSDGKSVVVGKSSTGDIALARFNPDGSSDTTFGPNHNGKVLTHVGYADLACAGEAVAIMPGTGSIVVAGSAWFMRPEYGFRRTSMVLVRYDANGSLARYNAIAQTNFGANFYAEAKDLAVQSDGKIVVAGTYANDNDSDMFVARFNSNFATDGSFGSGGVRIMGFGGDDVAEALAIDYSGTPSTNPRYGSILVAGTNTPNANVRPKFAVARVRPNGSMDSSFDGDGKATPYIGGSAEAHGLLVQSDGKVVVVGTQTVTSPLIDNKMAMIRLTTGGALDTTFGTAGNGVQTTDLFGDDRAADIIPSYETGKFLVGGSTNNKFAVVQYSNNGVIDRTFGTNGYTITQFTDDAQIAALASGPGRRFIAAGGSQFHTARYLQAGARQVSLFAVDDKAAEGFLGNTATFWVLRSERLPYPTRVFFTVGGNATRDVDYTGMVQTAGCPWVDIPANQTYAAVTITPVNDGILERTETATFTLNLGRDYEISSPSSVSISIADNARPLGGFRLQSRLASTVSHREQAPRRIFSQDLINALV
jgi:uncharacterized delta-60 repeat protein